MYSIYAGNTCIYHDISPLKSVKLISPKLSLSDSSAGSLTLTVPVTNIGYNLIEKLIMPIKVYRNDEEIWCGRVITEEQDFYKNRILYCEGELAFLNDSIQPQGEFHDITVSGFLQRLLTAHNNQVSSDKQFLLGTVTVTDSNDSLYRYTNYESTMECITEKLLERLGGHLRIRKANGARYLDYLADYPHENTQTIEFGKNLTDFTKSFDLTDFATVILPLGNQIEEGQIDALTNYLTVESVNGGSIFVQSQEAIATYGWIVKVVHWDDVKTASRLLRKAQNYLRDIQFDEMTLELSALDLHYMDVNCEAINILDTIRVISTPHGMNRLFPITKLEIPLDEPDNTVFSLGGKGTISLTGTYRSVQTSVNIELDTTKSSLRQEFRAADGVLESTISATYATKTALAGIESYLTSRITQTASDIRTEVSKKVGTSEFSTYMQQNYNSFLLGFNNNSRVVQIDTSGIGLYSGGNVSDSNRVIRLNGNGLQIWRDGLQIGLIGTNSFNGYPNYRGLVFDLTTKGSYMSWACQEEESGPYIQALAYAAKTGAGFAEKGFYFDDTIHMKGHKIDSVNLTNVRTNGISTFTGTRTFVTAIRATEDGGIEYDTITCNIHNGMFIN